MMMKPNQRLERSRTDRGWRFAVVGVSALVVAIHVHAVLAQAAPSKKPTLYERLGGYDGIASYIALVFPRVAQHPELSRMFQGHGKDSQQRQFQLVVEMMCQKTGGPCGYLGRPMRPVHDGLGISEANWA